MNCVTASLLFFLVKCFPFALVVCCLILPYVLGNCEDVSALAPLRQPYMSLQFVCRVSVDLYLSTYFHEKSSLCDVVRRLISDQQSNTTISKAACSKIVLHSVEAEKLIGGLLEQV